MRVGLSHPRPQLLRCSPLSTHVTTGDILLLQVMGPNVHHKMLPKSKCQVYIGYDEGSKAIKYYNVVIRNIITSRNFKFLDRDTLPPLDEIAKDPPCQGESSPSEGEREGADTQSKQSILRLQKCTRESSPESPCKCVQTEIDELRCTRDVHPDYKYLNDPFPDEEEAGIASISRPEVFAVVLEDECRSLKEARASLE